MSAYKTKLPKPLCKCSRPATFEVCNRFNAGCGYFCATCADKEVKQLDEADRQHNIKVAK